MAEWRCPNCKWNNSTKWLKCAKCGWDRSSELEVHLRDSQQHWKPIIESHLIAGESLIELVTDLFCDVNFIPHINYSPSSDGLVALTSYRLIVAILIEAPDCWRWLHIPAINYLSETPLCTSKPDKPYQAVILIPGGMGITVETQLSNKAHGEQLASILVNAFSRFATRKTDGDSMAAIITHEEDEERRKEDEERRRRQ